MAAAVHVETVLEDRRWQAAGLPALAQRACAATLGLLGMEAGPVPVGISLLGCDDARIAALNAGFRNRARPTNVLSWPARAYPIPSPGRAPPLPAMPPAGGALELGDIAIAYETCAAEAAQAGRALADHVQHLLSHATLHLLGYDHMNDEDARLMEALERKALASLGLPDPYGGQT